MILQAMSGGAEALLYSHQAAYRMMWKASDATPSQILEALGPRAAEVFVRGGDAVRFLLGVDTGRPIATMQPNEYEPPVPYTMHPDGTVTLDQ
jgi:hypothetical protein